MTQANSSSMLPVGQAAMHTCLWYTFSSMVPLQV
jgi:hypothetical protein